MVLDIIMEATMATLTTATTARDLLKLSLLLLLTPRLKLTPGMDTTVDMVSDTMVDTTEDDEDSYKRQFSRFIKLGVTAEELEGMYKKAHAAIRADPAKQAKPEKKVEAKRYNAKRLTYEERKAGVAARKADWLAKIEKGEASINDCREARIFNKNQ